MALATNQKPLYDEWRAKQPDPMPENPYRPRHETAQDEMPREKANSLRFDNALAQFRAAGMEANPHPQQPGCIVAKSRHQSVLFEYFAYSTKWCVAGTPEDCGTGISNLLWRLHNT